MLGSQGSRIVLLIVIIGASSINTKIIVTEILQMVKEPKIGISTRFKNSDIVFSNKTRQLAIKKQNYSDMSSVPTIRMQYEGSVRKRWRHIKGDTNIYLIKTLNFLNYHYSSNSEKMLLIDEKYEGIGKKWMQNDYFCLYGQSDLTKQNFQTFLQECLKNRIQHSKTNQQVQSKITQTSNLAIITIILVSLSLLTSSKLLYFEFLCKQESVV